MDTQEGTERLTPKSTIIWLWIAITVGLASLLVYEMLEHTPAAGASRSHNFWAESALVGISLLFLLFLGLRRLVKERPQPAADQHQSPNGQSVVQRVLVVPSDSLLGAGIRSLLSLDARLEIRGLDLTDEDTLIEEIKSYKPNIVVLDEFEPMLGSVSFRALFAHSPQLRIVGVSTESGQVRVYNGNQYTITQPGEFARVITANMPG